MKKYLSFFAQIGIDEKSGLIYFSLLEYGRCPISEIVKNTNIHRVEVYRKLPYLLEIGLIKEVKIWKRKNYVAAKPEKIHQLIHAARENSEKIVQEIEEKYVQLEEKPNVVYKQWAKAITQVFDDMVQSLWKWEVFYRVSSETNVDISNTYLSPKYRKIREQKELQRYVIESSKTAKKKEKQLGRESVIMPENYEQFDQNIQMLLYKNTLAYIDYGSETVITIENKKMADFQKKLFKALFSSLRK